MQERAEAGYVTATACADALARQGNMSFRQAHHMMGRLVNEAIACGGVPLSEVAGTAFTDVTTESVVSHASFGGGPGPASMANILIALEEDWRGITRWKHQKRSRWTTASSRLDDAARELLNHLEVEKN